MITECKTAMRPPQITISTSLLCAIRSRAVFEELCDSGIMIAHGDEHGVVWSVDIVSDDNQEIIKSLSQDTQHMINNLSVRVNVMNFIGDIIIFYSK